MLKGEEEEKEEEKEEEEVKINNTDWQTLNQAIDETYNQFSQRLQELYPITDIELKVCLLLKINLSPLQIATIATRSKQAISSIRKRLYKNSSMRKEVQSNGITSYKTFKVNSTFLHIAYHCWALSPS